MLLAWDELDCVEVLALVGVTLLLDWDELDCVEVWTLVGAELD